MACFSGARRKLANGGGSSSGMNSPTSSCRRPLPDAEEFEGLPLELGKPGHWSAGSLANRRGETPGFWWPPWTPLGAGSETWWWCGPSLPWGLPLYVLLAAAAPPRSRVGTSRVVDAEPRIRCLIFQLQLEGCTARCCASRQWGTVTGSSLIRQGGLAATMGLGTSLRGRAVSVVRLEGTVANGRRSWPVFQLSEEDTQKRCRRGVRANLSSIKLPPHRHRLPLPSPGAFRRIRC